MGCATDILLIAQGINHDFSIIDATETESNNTSTYDAVITNKALRRKTEKLFKDGHHARAVEEAYKLLDNTVKVKAGLQQTDLTGAKLMQTAFSPNKPLLRLNECVSTSEQNEQSGYMQILAAWLELEIPEPTILTGKILKNAHFSFYRLPTILWSAFWFQKK